MHFKKPCEGKQYIHVADGIFTFTAAFSQGTWSFMDVLAECTLLQKPCRDTPVLRPPACLLINTNKSLQSSKSHQPSGISSIYWAKSYQWESKCRILGKPTWIPGGKKWELITLHFPACVQNSWFILFVIIMGQKAHLFCITWVNFRLVWEILVSTLFQ